MQVNIIKSYFLNIFFSSLLFSFLSCLEEFGEFGGDNGPEVTAAEALGVTASLTVWLSFSDFFTDGYGRDIFAGTVFILWTLPLPDTFKNLTKFFWCRKGYFSRLLR